MKGPPGPGPLAQLPLALRLLRDPRAVIMDCTRRYGTLWQSRMPGRRGLVPLYWMMGPAGNERILAPPYKDDFSFYEGYGFTMEPLLGRDILFLLDDSEEDAAHRRRHRLLLPAFHPRMDEAYLAFMQELILARLSRWPKSGELDLAAEIKQLAFHAVAHLLFAADEADLPVLFREFEELGLGLYTPLRLRLPGTRFSRGLRAREKLADYIRHRARRFVDGTRADGSLLAQLFANGAPEQAALPEETIIGEVLAFLFAGYDTTASMLTSLFVCLSERPEALERLASEARSLRTMSYSSLDQQPWLSAALLETERLAPPLVFALRGVLRDFSFCGHEIRAGSKVAYSPYYTGRLAELFPEPERFLPERFSDGKRPPPYSVLGFGGGHRACIGKRFAQLEMRLLVSLLLQRFELKFLSGQREEVFFNPTLQRKYGFRVRVQRREAL